MTGKTARRLALAVMGLLVLTGCREDAAVPEPTTLTRSAVGHYCNMIVVDHPGPKAQVFERDRSEPRWFSSVRDGMVYLTLPGEAQNATAVYVHDMSRAESWERPQDDGIWIKAETALYVIGSSRRGGMGAKETVPFSDQKAAEAFRRKFGGRIVSYEDIPRDYIVGDANDHRTDSPHGHHKPERGGHGS